jgi:hypothetical protein
VYIRTRGDAEVHTHEQVCKHTFIMGQNFCISETQLCIVDVGATTRKGPQIPCGVYMCVVYVCIRARMYVCVHVCMCKVDVGATMRKGPQTPCVCMCVYVCIRACIHVCIYTYMYVCVHVCMCIADVILT